MHLVGFIIRIYHDAQSHEGQILPVCYVIRAFFHSDANCNMIVCGSISHPTSLYKLPDQTLIS